MLNTFGGNVSSTTSHERKEARSINITEAKTSDQWIEIEHF